MAGPVRYPKGVTTAAKTEPMGEFILPDMTKAHVYMEDFDYYTAANWTVTEVGVATQALTDGDGGRLLITNAAADNDSSFNQKVGESFLLETGKKLWFDCLFQASDATQSQIIMGLQITDTTPIDVSDGIFFLKLDGAADILMIVEKDEVGTTLSMGDLVDATDIRLSFFYNGGDSIKAFVDGVHIGTLVTTNLPDNEVLTVTFGIENGEASAKTMTVDYIMVAKER